MPIVREERSIVLYALYACGGKGSTSRIIDFILMNRLMKERGNDYELRTGGEEVVRNNLRWASNNLKNDGEITKPSRGVWMITEKGRARVERIAVNVHKRSAEQLSELDFDLVRYGSTLLERFSELGAKVLADRATYSA